MTDFGDRVLVLIIIATGLAGLFGWVTGTYLQGEARIEGIERFFIHAALIAIYFLILLGLWKALQRIDTQADSQQTP